MIAETLGWAVGCILSAPYSILRGFVTASADPGNSFTETFSTDRRESR